METMRTGLASVQSAKGEFMVRNLQFWSSSSKRGGPELSSISQVRTKSLGVGEDKGHGETSLLPLVPFPLLESW